MTRRICALGLLLSLLLASGCDRVAAAPSGASSKAASPNSASPRAAPANAAATPASLPATADQIAAEPFLVAPAPQCVDIAVTYQRAKRFYYPPQRARPDAVATKAGDAPMGTGGISAGAAAEQKSVASSADLAAEPAAEATKTESPSAAPSKSAQASPMAAKAKKQSAAAIDDARPLARAPRREPVRAPVTATTRYLSADDSNSTASPAIVRKLIRLRQYVHPDYVRTYEFLNDADFAYPPPTDAELAIHPELRPGKAAGEYQMQIGVRAIDRPRSAMLPLNVTLLLDVSGSMAGEPFELARGFIEKLASTLRPGEQLAIVTVSREARTLLEPRTVDASTAAAVAQALGGISPTDITNLELGIAAAYELAARSYDASRTNRVIVVSDGAANSGKTSRALIAKHAADADRQGIYLMGVAVGAGLDDKLMNTVTDAGRGAYLFLDGPAAIERALADDRFVANFDLAVKDVRLKLVLPPGFAVKEFHGEQISAVASEVVPQYLASNDQMIYHLVVATELAPAAAAAARWELAAEYRPLGGAAKTASASGSTAELMTGGVALKKGDGLVRFAESLKRIQYPLEENRTGNLAEIDGALADISAIYNEQRDVDLRDAIALLKAYRVTLGEGEQSMLACDRKLESPPVVLGIAPEQVRQVIVKGSRPQRALRGLHQLLGSARLLPLEGFRFLALGSGPIGSRHPASTSPLSDGEFADPAPRFMGQKKYRKDRSSPVYDLHQVVLALKAPANARSFSFDFNYFSAEYPEFVNQTFNDTFYAILEAASTNGGKSTNISFDPKNNSIEVDNNYFENAFHPIPNTNTGFDHDGSTGWLRTSWPIGGGEEFTLTFSVHDEGDGIYDSVVLIDNFRFHDFAAVGNTDPLN